jgi:hypothetical protein
MLRPVRIAARRRGRDASRLVAYPLRISFDAKRWPNAVTIRDLIAERMGMGVHCQKCRRHVVMDPAKLHLTVDTPVPSLAGRFKCTRCGSKQTEAWPEWPGRDG